MAMLSDTDINRCLNSKHLIVSPILDHKLQVQPASIDVRLGDTLLIHPQSLKKDFGLPLDPRDPATLVDYLEPIKLIESEGYTLSPNEFVLGCLYEYVHIPNDLVCRIEGRSSLGRLGVMVHITAGFVDPGFRGHLTLEIVNANCRPVKIYPGMRIAQLAFHRLEGPVERPYGPGRGSKYHSFNGPVGCQIQRGGVRYAKQRLNPLEDEHGDPTTTETSQLGRTSTSCKKCGITPPLHTPARGVPTAERV